MLHASLDSRIDDILRNTLSGRKVTLSHYDRVLSAKRFDELSMVGVIHAKELDVWARWHERGRLASEDGDLESTRVDEDVENWCTQVAAGADLDNLTVGHVASASANASDDDSPLEDTGLYTSFSTTSGGMLRYITVDAQKIVKTAEVFRRDWLEPW